MNFNVRENIIALMPKWKGERLPDGRPKVPDKYLKALHELTLEEVWKPIFVKGYQSQFEGRLLTILHSFWMILNTVKMAFQEQYCLH
jgi:hypothetical protein